MTESQGAIVAGVSAGILITLMAIANHLANIQQALNAIAGLP